MKTRKPIQAKNTETIIKAILPEDFRIASDKTSNGYKFLNLLYGVEVDMARDYLQHIYDNSFLESSDLSLEGIVYEAQLSGLPSNQFLNSTVPGGVQIKVTNWGDSGGEYEFWDGPPTRVIEQTPFSISGIVPTGSLIGLNYFRENPSGYGYLIVNSHINQSEYSNYSGSSWKIYLDNQGVIETYSGEWPGVGTQNFDTQGNDDLLTPLGSGYLSKTYPLTRTIKDDSGVYRIINHYEPYLGWVRDVDFNVVAKVDYFGNYYYDGDGKKTWYRTAFNNPYGSGNYTSEYLELRNIPISGTLKLYDIDILDNSGNATEVSMSGTSLYKLKSSNMLIGAAGDYYDKTDPSGEFDPIYVGYDSVVPLDRGFGDIEGQAANLLQTTSWAYQQEGGYVDEGTMRYVEGSGDFTNRIKINNPYSRYVAEYKFRKYNYAKYITSLEASKYLSLDTFNPTFSIGTIFNNEEQLDYSFTNDPKFSLEKSKFLTFDGWKIRPLSKISRIDFSIPILIQSGILDTFKVVPGRYDSIGYQAGFVPDITGPDSTTSRNYSLNCPFKTIVSLGTVTESDLSGSGNYLEWFNNGANEIYRIPAHSAYGKRIRYVNNSGYYYINSQEFIKDNTFFRFSFRSLVPNELTLMELLEDTNDYYIKVIVKTDGTVVIYSNGVEYYTRQKVLFGREFNDIILRYYPDKEYTDNPVFEIYQKGNLGYTQMDTFLRETTKFTVSSTYLHVYQNCSIDADGFQIYYETDNGNTI